MQLFLDLYEQQMQGCEMILMMYHNRPALG
jgi:hypothetical protein